MERGATREMIAKVCDEIEGMGLTAHPMPGANRTAIGVTGNKAHIDSDRVVTLQGVREIIHVTRPYKLVSREFYPDNTVVEINGVKIGGPHFAVIAGPCSVESREQCFAIAEKVAKSGAKIMRGGAYKPRTSPYSFQGLGLEGLKILAEVRKEFGLAVATEAIDSETVKLVAEHADIIQIGARNMQNFSLLRAAGKAGKPVLLKRGISATLEELLMAAEYLLAEGNRDVILCERGVRTFADHTRNTLDLSAVPFVKRNTHLPIIVDPSHGTGRRDKVLPLSQAAIACGADGLIVEVHHQPEKALSDGKQSITPDMFDTLMERMRIFGGILDKVCP